MNHIELSPEVGREPIAGDWKESSALYLVGGSGGFRLCPAIQSGDMPVAVLCRSEAGAVIAPVNPLCHVSDTGQEITPLTTGCHIQLGTEKYRVTWAGTTGINRLLRKRLLSAALIVLAALCGWLLHDALGSQAPTPTVADIYTF